MKLYLIFLIFLSVFSANVLANDFRNFSTDFCTGYKEGPQTHPKLWAHCCIEHDLFFWAGGSKKDRLETDKRLKNCVARTGETFHAQLIYLGVTIGGLSPFKIKNKQWGNAWEKREAYKKLTESETLEIIHFLELSGFDLDLDLIQSFSHQLKSRLD